MADFEYTVGGAVGVLRFNRPEKLNAVTYGMLSLIEEAAQQARSDPRVRCSSSQATARAFSAGTDLQEPDWKGV